MAEYALIGTKDCIQVEPEASYWFECPILKQVSIDEVLTKLGTLPPYPTEGSEDEAKELKELKDRYEARYEHFKPGYLSAFLSDEQKYFRPAAAKAILPRFRIKHEDHHHYVYRHPHNGVELATLFEAEPPGQWHRHVLDVLFDPGIERGFCQQLSPPRQALIWAALDVAIVSALNAAWYIKWLADPGVGRRRRPAEADNTLKVLFDYRIQWNKHGRIVRSENNPKISTPTLELPADYKGSPRHPAYTSGHSTYSSAASRVLGCFFPDHKTDFEKLADNIGEARLFGGVHWPSDHKFGQTVGQAVGDLVIQQLNKSGIKRDFRPDPANGYGPPSRQELEAQETNFKTHCESGNENFCLGVIPSDAQQLVAMHTVQIDETEAS